MRRSVITLLAGLVLGTVAFLGFFYRGSSSCWSLMRESKPELAWLKREFALSNAQFARVLQLHEAYLPRCQERCRRIREQERKLQQLISQPSSLTPEIKNLLAERAQTRAQCETEMLDHFLTVSRVMSPEQGRRYLAWITEQSSLRSQVMEQSHRVAAEPRM